MSFRPGDRSLPKAECLSGFHHTDLQLVGHWQVPGDLRFRPAVHQRCIALSQQTSFGSRPSGLPEQGAVDWMGLLPFVLINFISDFLALSRPHN